MGERREERKVKLPLRRKCVCTAVSKHVPGTVPTDSRKPTTHSTTDITKLACGCASLSPGLTAAGPPAEPFVQHMYIITVLTRPSHLAPQLLPHLYHVELSNSILLQRQGEGNMVLLDQHLPPPAAAGEVAICVAVEEGCSMYPID